MVFFGVGRGSSVGLVVAWHGGLVAWCGSLSYGDGSVDGSLRRWFCSLTAMGLLMGLLRWLMSLLMGFGFNGFWDRWLRVPIGFVQRWRSCVVVGVDRGKVMCGGFDGSNGVHVWWF